MWKGSPEKTQACAKGLVACTNFKLKERRGLQRRTVKNSVGRTLLWCRSSSLPRHLFQSKSGCLQTTGVRLVSASMTGGCFIDGSVAWQRANLDNHFGGEGCFFGEKDAMNATPNFSQCNTKNVPEHCHRQTLSNWSSWRFRQVARCILFQPNCKENVRLAWSQKASLQVHAISGATAPC